MVFIAIGVVMPVIVGVLVSFGFYGTAATVAMWTIMFWLHEGVDEIVMDARNRLLNDNKWKAEDIIGWISK